MIQQVTTSKYLNNDRTRLTHQSIATKACDPDTWSVVCKVGRKPLPFTITYYHNLLIIIIQRYRLRTNFYWLIFVRYLNFWIFNRTKTLLIYLNTTFCTEKYNLYCSWQYLITVCRLQSSALPIVCMKEQLLENETLVLDTSVEMLLERSRPWLLLFLFYIILFSCRTRLRYKKILYADDVSNFAPTNHWDGLQQFEQKEQTN